MFGQIVHGSNCVMVESLYLIRMHDYNSESIEKGARRVSALRIWLLYKIFWNYINTIIVLVIVLVYVNNTNNTRKGHNFVRFYQPLE